MRAIKPDYVDSILGAKRVCLAVVARAIPYILLLGFSALYISTLTAAYTYDSIAYATQISRYATIGKLGWLFHPHHLLYNALGYCSWKLYSWLGMDVDPLKSLQYMNALFGALGAVLIYEILRRGGLHTSHTRDDIRGVGVLPALTAALIMSTAYGYWTCATDGRVNTPALIGVMLVIGLGWGMLSLHSTKQAVALAAATVLAVLLHQSNGLLIFAGVGAILMIDTLWRERLKLSLVYLSTFSLGMAAAYLGIGIFIKGAHSISELQAWMLAYAHDGRWWSLNIPQNLQLDLVALTRVFIPTESQWGTVLSPAIPVALVAAFSFGALLFVRRPSDAADEHYHKKLALLAMVAVPYTAFFTVWNPGYFVFWLPVGFTLVMWLVTAASALGSKWNYALSALGMLWVMAAVATNLPTIDHKTHREHNSDLAVCDAIKKHTRPGDLVLITGVGLHPAAKASYVEVYLPYFTSVSTKNVLGEYKHWNSKPKWAVLSLRGIMEKRINRGNRVLVLKEFTSPEVWKDLYQRYPNAKGLQGSLLRGYKLQPVVDDGKPLAYRLIRD